MKILLNGQPWETPGECRVSTLLEQLRHGGRRLAVEINGEIVPRSSFETVLLRENDCVEIVQAIGGG